MQTPTHKPIPDDVTIRRRTIIAVVIAAVVVVGVVGVSWWAFGRQSPKTVGQQQFEPAQSTVPTSTETTQLAAEEPSQTAEATSSAESTTAAKAAPIPRIGFRLGTTLYLAKEDGTDAVVMSRSERGPFAVAPSGRALAWIDDKTNTLWIGAEGAKPVKIPGQAASLAPVWSADSAEVFYRRLDTSSTLTPLIQRVPATGGTPITVGTGEYVAVAGDGAKVIGPMGSQGNASRTIEFIGPDGRVQIAMPGVVSGLSLDADHIFVAVNGPASQVGIWQVGRDGSGMKRLVTGLPKGERGSITDLMMSPDGAWLAFAVTGDDGYSRLFAVPAKGGAVRKLSIRRDGYATEWTADSTSLIFIEGNEFQGEPTALMRVHPDGTSRFMIVSGATL